MTAWDKSEVSIINSGSYHIPYVFMPSIDPDNPISSTSLYHSVPVQCDKIIFLRIPINDETTHFNSLLSIIDNFSLPRSIQQLPLTAIRKFFNQLLISKLCAQIALHPITPTHAFSLESWIMSKIHFYFSFPFMPSSDILHLPISFHGFGFASISHFNDACMISGVLWDLNHHVPLFHKMAQITISDWQCSISHCIYPFSSCGLLRSFHLSHLLILIQFTLAHQVMCSLKLLIFPSDQSFIMNGEISLVHLAQLTPDPPHITSLRCYTHSPYQFLKTWGVWHTLEHSPLALYF